MYFPTSTGINNSPNNTLVRLYKTSDYNTHIPVALRCPPGAMLHLNSARSVHSN